MYVGPQKAFVDLSDAMGSRKHGSGGCPQFPTRSRRPPIAACPCGSPLPSTPPCDAPRRDHYVLTCARDLHSSLL